MIVDFVVADVAVVGGSGDEVVVVVVGSTDDELVTNDGDEVKMTGVLALGVSVMTSLSEDSDAEAIQRKLCCVAWCC